MAEGCNLTQRAGPITRQAQQVLALVNQKNAAYFERWRKIQLFTPPEWLKALVESTKKMELEKNDKVIAELEEQIDAARKPKSHFFELKPVEQTPVPLGSQPFS